MILAVGTSQMSDKAMKSPKEDILSEPTRHFSDFSTLFRLKHTKLHIHLVRLMADDSFFFLPKLKNEDALRDVLPLALAYAVARGVRS